MADNSFDVILDDLGKGEEQFRTLMKCHQQADDMTSLEVTLSSKKISSEASGLTREKLTSDSEQQKAPTMQSIAGAALDKSGRLDLNQRPPAPEAGQYTNQLLHSAGL